MPYNVCCENVDYLNPEYFVPIDIENIKRPRHWQPDCISMCKDEKYVFTQAPCGSGKTTLQVFLGILDILFSDLRRKQLYTVPQEHIHKGFVGEAADDFLNIELNGTEISWHIADNFCVGENRRERLKKWLLRHPVQLAKSCKKDSITGLNAICSHAALVAVWNEMTEKEKKKTIKYLSLRIDEAHRTSYVFETDGDSLSPEECLAIDKEATGLGKICKFIVDNNDGSTKICLTTATGYRGDRRPILSPAVKEKFTFFSLPWIEHWKTLGIKNFSLLFEEYVGNPIDQIVKNIAKEPNEKHIIVMPSTGSKWRNGFATELEELKEKLIKQGMIVLDLVTPGLQKKNKALLLREPKSRAEAETNPSKFDVVIMCMLGREGTDWCPCSRIHNAAIEGSLTLAVQTAGRLFRRYIDKVNGQIVGKTTAKLIYYIVKFPSLLAEGVDKRKLITDRTNALLYAMIWLDDMAPILMPEFPSENDVDDVDEDDEQGSNRVSGRLPLKDFIGEDYQNILRELVKQVDILNEQDKTEENIKVIVDRILDSYEIYERRTAARDGFYVQLLRTWYVELRIRGMNIEWLRKVGFDKIVEKYGPSGSIIFEANLNTDEINILTKLVNVGPEADKEKFRQILKEIKAGAFA
tara:strand:+ start:39 stop:1949 length:1911 start_codon:yes stop_codon:yes gene_type:complete